MGFLTITFLCNQYLSETLVNLITGCSITFVQTGDLVLTSIFIKKHTKRASVQYNNQYTMNDFLLN